MRDLVLIRCADPARLARVLEKSVSLVERAAVSGAKTEVWRHRRSGLALIQSSAPGAVDKLAIHRTRREAFSYSGFVAAPAYQPAEVRRLVSIEGQPAMSRSPGGIATYFLADARARRLIAWSSHAGMEGPYYTAGPECTAISNRPLLSHLVGRQADRPQFSMRWAQRVLLGGATLWDDTPFEETWQPPPRSTVIADERVRFLPHPLPLSGRYDKRDPAGVAALCDAALEAVSPLGRWPQGELWLSGGKDSRFAAALIRRAGHRVDAVTHGREGAGEGAAAAAVALALGMEHRVTAAAGIATDDDLLPTILANLHRSDGLLGEARVLAYGAPPHRGQPLIQGQAHHPRGGYQVRLALGDAIREALIDSNLEDGPLVEEALVAERRGRLAEILDSYPVRRPSELAYWLYSDWRMTRWTSAAYRRDVRARPVVWPMMDERVLQVIARLAPIDRVQEVAYFAALCRIAPELAPIPLYESTWRFDASERGKTEFPDGYEERRSPLKEQGRGRTAERRFSTIQPLFRQAVHELRLGSELRRMIRPDVLRASCEEDDPAVALDRPHMQIINFMWKATAIALVLEGTWLTATT